MLAVWAIGGAIVWIAGWLAGYGMVCLKSRMEEKEKKDAGK